MSRQRYGGIREWEASMNNPLRRLGELGQSVWYDNLNRELLRSGELKRMIEEDGVTGVTSNPSIFEKAIAGSKIYDNHLHELVDEGKDVYGIYEGLAVEDIRQAADLLLPVFEKTSGADGYVSLEVSPELAYDTDGTLAQVRHLFKLVDRKNLMIKVPATHEGVSAVKELIADGININITLIFSLAQYRDTAAAYLEGLGRWTASGGDPAAVASVASFFVSRVDTLVDERLGEIPYPELRSTATDLMGRAGIANAKMAYALYKELFHGEPFAAFREQGARPQRVLWASTSTKNPNYPDTYYVDHLLGPETVNTLPQVTLDAYRDHGQPIPRLEEDLDQARELFPKLAELGISMDEVMGQLLEDGVRLFADSFSKLLENVGRKRTRLLRGWGHRSASVGSLQKQVDETLSQWDKEELAEKLWAGDCSIWKDDEQECGQIRQRLGWLQVVDTMTDEVSRLKDFAEEIRSLGYTRAVLLGMGGSSLAAEVFASCYGVADGYLDLLVLDTTIPRSIIETEWNLDLAHTLFIVASKSGGTIEVASLYSYFRSRVEQVLGYEAGKNFIAITDPGTSLGKLASEHGFRKVFLNPSDIGGRFSALSYFGLVPAALIGADIGRILMRASQSVESSKPEVPALENPGLWLGAIIAQASLAGIDKLSLIVSPPVRSFGYWLEQLIAESTGKEGKGIVPIEGEPVGGPEHYERDRLFVYLRLDDDGTYDQFVSTMESSGHPVVTLRLHTAYDLGREMFRWEFATAVAGAILKINPFDQPNVQEAKDFTTELLESRQAEGGISTGNGLKIDDPGLLPSLKDLMDQRKPGDYVAFNAFLHPSRESVDALQSIRTVVRDKFRTATALGFGPRYLHSTGQIHKGGPNKGLYIEITMEDPKDVEIPGKPYTFGELKSAQSLGDYEALKRRERRILLVHLSSESDLAKLLELAKSL